MLISQGSLSSLCIPVIADRYHFSIENRIWLDVLCAVVLRITGSDLSICTDPMADSRTEAQRTPQFLVPFTRDRNFVGREYLIHRIEELFENTDDGPRVALTGLGGVG